MYNDFQSLLPSEQTPYTPDLPNVPFSRHASRFKKKRYSRLILTALVLVSFGFGSGYYIGQVTTQFLASQPISPVLYLSQSVNTLPTENSITPTLATTTQSNSDLSIPEIATRTAHSIVEITTEVVTSSHRSQYVSEGAGSGVIFSSDGYIVTNNHVIDGANKITVRLKTGEEYTATLIGTDSQTDLAVIKVNATNLSPATLGNSSTLQVGELAVAIGNPLGELGGTVTNGIISALDREILLDGQTMNLLQTNAAINPGNSGGGLFNVNGELIGVVVAKSAGSDIEGIGFAIPVDDVKVVVESLLEHGYVQGRPILNMSLLDITSSQMAMRYGVSRTGVYIADFPTNSNPESQGFQIGDCILSIADTQVSSSSMIKTLLQSYSVGDTLPVAILRGNQTLTLNLTLSEYKPSV